MKTKAEYEDRINWLKENLPKWKEDMKRATPNVSPMAKFLAGQLIEKSELELNRLESLVKVMP